MSSVTVSSLPLPDSYEAVTPEWLTAAVCEQYSGTSIIGYRLGPPDNASTNRRRIFLEYNDSERPDRLPEALFCKATHDASSRAMAEAFDSARGETHFYNCIRPHLHIEAPRSLYSRFDARSFNSMVLLPDLTNEGMEFCQYQTPITRDRIEGQLALLATVHGTCHQNAEIKSQLGLLQTWPSFFQRFVSQGLKEHSEAGFLGTPDAVPPRLYSRFIEVWPAVLRSVERHNHLPMTLIHGDAHPKNWYVTRTGEMGLCDWQTCSRGHWSRDVAHVMSALRIEDRRAWEQDLLRLYVELMQSAGGPATRMDEAWSHYRQQMMSALVWWTITCKSQDGFPALQPDNLLVEYVRRVSTAVDDLESLDSF